MTREEEVLLEAYRDCTLCPRLCHVDRTRRPGACGMGSQITAARAALHFWEEPCISGSRGSGAVFFSGCSLGCIYCQNREISAGGWGRTLTVPELTRAFLSLQEQGAANLNLVTAAHFAPSVALALKLAKEQGLSLPVVYNSSGYERPETLRLLEGLVDIYLPDCKYLDSELSGRLSRAPDYPEAVRAALTEMVRQTGPCVFDGEGYLVRGTVVRHLILPGHTKNARQVIDYLLEAFGETVYLSLMNQYTPLTKEREGGGTALPPELRRPLTRREYDRVLDYAMTKGLTRGFYQSGETARESFIPPFDLTGIEKLCEGTLDKSL